VLLSLSHQVDCRLCWEWAENHHHVGYVVHSLAAQRLVMHDLLPAYHESLQIFPGVVSVPSHTGRWSALAGTADQLKVVMWT
jgi:hypothetical protein